MPMSVTIRSARRADLPVVSALLATIWHATYDVIYGPERVAAITARWHDVDTLARGLDRADATFLVAVDAASRVVGTAAFHRVEQGVLMLDRLYVDPAAQRAGIGSALLDAGLATFPDAATVRLEVEPANARAIAYYERRGFVITGRTADCGASGDGIPAVVMTLSLPHSA